MNMINQKKCKFREIGEKGKDQDGWFIILRSLNSELIKARVGDDIFHKCGSLNGRLVLSKINGIKKRLSTGGKLQPKPKNCIVDLTYQNRVLSLKC